MNHLEERRNFLKNSSLIAAALTFGAYQTSSASPMPASNAMPISFDACMALTPVQTANQSSLVQQAWQYLQQQATQIQEPSIRLLTTTIYNNPVPQVVQRLDPQTRQELWQALTAKGYTTHSQANFLAPIPAPGTATMPFNIAPGSGYQSHHAYPGGLATHVATNTHITHAIVDTYHKVYGYEVDRDIAVAAQLLHDLHKPYVFQWQPDGSCRAEQTLAGTGEHHILSAAELIYRQAPAALVIAMVCAHQPPMTEQDRHQIATWLDAAAMIAGTDPVAYGLIINNSGKIDLHAQTPQEGYICHLGDHDFVLSVPAVKNTVPVIAQIATTDYKISDADLHGKPFNTLRNYLYATYSAMRIHEALIRQGEDGIRGLMHAAVTPA